MVIKKLFLISQLISFTFLSFVPRNDFLVLRRIKHTGSIHNKILEKIFSLSENQDKELRITSATALVKLGKEDDGYKILKEFSSSTDPQILLAVARAYLDLEKIDPFNKIRGIQLLDKIALEKITEAELGLEIAREYFKHRLFVEAERVLLYLESHFVGIQDKIFLMRKKMERRRTIFALIENILSENLPPNQRIKSLVQLVNTEVDLEELVIVKEVFLTLAESQNLEILIGLAELFKEGLIIFPWQFKILQNLILKNTYPLAEASLETARIMGFNYLQNIINIQKELVDLKHTQDMFLQYALSRDLGNLQIREGMIDTLIKAWEIHRGEILRRKIIESLGYWGINSMKAKGFIERIIKEDKIFKKEAKEALDILQKKEEVLSNELFYIERKLAEGNVSSPHPLLFYLLGGLWTVYGFEKARDILLAMDGDKNFHSYSEETISNLRFRFDETVFTRFNSHLRNSNDILKQFLSLIALIEPWWIEEASTYSLLEGFLQRLCQEKTLDYLELQMAVFTANPLILYGNFMMKNEIALLSLGLLDKFPPRPDEKTMELYHQIIWMLGEHLRLPGRISKIQSLKLRNFALNSEFSPDNFIFRRIRGNVLNRQTIIEGVRRFSKSEDKMVRASAAGALINLGEVSEGKAILEVLSKDADPWVQFIVAKTYLGLADFRKKGTDILDRLGQSFSSAELLFRVAWEWYRLGNLDKADQTLFWLTQRFPSLSPELTQAVAILQLRIGARGELSQLLEQLNSLALPEYKLDKAKKIWEKLSSVTTPLIAEDIADIRIAFEKLLKEIYTPQFSSSNSIIKMELVSEILRKNPSPFSWWFDILDVFLRENEPHLQEEAFRTLEKWGEVYGQKFNLIGFQKWMEVFKKTQDMFLGYEHSYALGNFSFQEGIISTLIELWEKFSGGLYFRRLIIQALEFWGINSAPAKKFLDKIWEEEQGNELGELARMVSSKIADKEFIWGYELRKIVEQVDKEIDPARSVWGKETFFSFPSALWSIYGFPQAKLVLLKMAEKTKDKSSPYAQYKNEIYSNLRFRYDQEVFTHLKSRLFGEIDISLQRQILEVLIEPWWAEKKETKDVLFDFLKHLVSFQNLKKEELEMVKEMANVLFKFGNPQEKLETAHILLVLLNKFPSSFFSPYYEYGYYLFWLIGNGLQY